MMDREKMMGARTKCGGYDIVIYKGFAYVKKDNAISIKVPLDGIKNPVREAIDAYEGVREREYGQISTREGM